MASKTIAGIDIGTWATKIVVAERLNEREFEILGSGLALSSGLRRGVIVDLAEAGRGVHSAFEEAQRLSGVEFEEVRAVVGGIETKSKSAHAMVAVSRADSEISPDDISRVLKEAQMQTVSPNRFTVAVLPRQYLVDGEGGIQDPVGMNGMRLEADALIIETSASFFKNLSRVLAEAGLEVEQFVPSILSGVGAVVDRKRRELGVLAMDFGGATTSLSIFEEGKLCWAEVLPIGAMHITNDLAIGLKTAVEIAEEVKCEYGTASPKGVGKDERVDLAKFGDNSAGLAPRRLIAEIIEARLIEIFSLVSKSLKGINKARLLPGGVVLFGGGAKLLGVADSAKRHLKLPVTIGFPKDLKGMVDRVEDPIFANALGAILFSTPSPGGEKREEGRKGPGLGRKFRGLFRIFAP